MEAGGTVGWCSIGRGVVRRAGLTEGPDSGHGTAYGRLLARAFFHLDAMAHFVGYRPEPQQPIAFPPNIHVQDVELACLDCHITAAQGPRASIPDIRTCWGCQATTATDRPEIQKMKGYYDNGHDIPWQRVWGWVEESHVRFNHAPHIRAK